MNIFSDIGWFFSFVISRPLGWVLYWCYYVTKNYGLALLLFTVVTRVILLPLAVKQQKSSAEMLRLQPKMAAIQKKYAKDKQKLQEEQMKLYQEEGYNPFGGCLPLLIQMPILWGLFNVIYKPFTYILGLGKGTIQKIVEALHDPILAIAGNGLPKSASVAQIVSNSRSEIYIAGAMKDNMDKLAGIWPAGLPTIDFRFLSFDLTKNPNFQSLYILVPILCYLTSLASSWLSMKMQPQMAGQNGGAAGMNKSMILIMPFISAFFSLSVPSGIGLYWIYTNLFMILQVFLLMKFYSPAKLVEKAELAAEEKKRKRREKLGLPVDSIPEKTEETQSEEAAQPDKKPNGAKPAAAKPARPSGGSGKKTKKQLMEENRRRLASARQKDNGGKNQ